MSQAFLIKSATILDTKSSHHGHIRDVLIKNNRIHQISENIAKQGEVIEGEDLCLSPGWFDMWCHFQDPGYEHKEDLFSGAVAALAGGFTGVALLPNTSPVTQRKGQVNYFLKFAKSAGLQLLPYGAVTHNCEGLEITEMIDLHHAGAVAFTDGIHPLWHSDVFLRSLLYLQKFNGLLITRSEIKELREFGVMHEGIQSTQLGMKGIPVLAETLSIERDIEILKYTGGRLHFANVSSEAGVDLIRKAKKQGLNLSCDVSAHHLRFTDRDLLDFDANFKVSPPFRSEKDRKALIKGLKDGTIDVITTAHQPHDEESKKLEFDLADFGISSIQSTLPILNDLSKDLTWEVILDKVVYNPRKLLGQSIPPIEEESHCNLCLFSPSSHWVLDEKTNQSKSTFSPFWKKELRGKVLRTWLSPVFYESQA